MSAPNENPDVHIATGTRHAYSAVVEGTLVTDVGGTLPNPVLSTPGVVYLMEEAAVRCIASQLPDGCFSVGYEVSIRHVGVVGSGESCTAEASLVDVVDGRKLRFDVAVRQDDRTIAVGQHERRVLTRERPRGN